MRKLQEKYRIDLPAISVPGHVSDMIDAALKHIQQAKSSLIEAIDAAEHSHELQIQLEKLVNEFVRANDNVVGGLVDLLEREDYSRPEFDLFEAKLKATIRKIVKEYAQDR